MIPNKFEVFLNAKQKEIPKLKVIYNSKLTAFIFKVLSFFTNKRYTTFVMTLGRTIHFPYFYVLWSDVEKYIYLRHEIMHVRRFYNWPFSHYLWPINYFINAFLYLFCFPVFLTYRAKFEREGYVQTILTDYELNGLNETQKLDYILWLADLFSGPTYFYMWTKKRSQKWAIQLMEDITTGKITNNIDKVT